MYGVDIYEGRVLDMRRGGWGVGGVMWVEGGGTFRKGVAYLGRGWHI